MARNSNPDTAEFETMPLDRLARQVSRRILRHSEQLPVIEDYVRRVSATDYRVLGVLVLRMLRGERIKDCCDDG
jgi:hypothetical protein